MTQLDWPSEVAQTVGREVRRYRAARRLSAQKLADACTDLGVPIERSVLANLENGRRSLITVPEVIALAQVLSVPPVMLIYPVGETETVHVVPRFPADTFAAAKWFSGEGPFPRLAGSDNQAEVDAVEHDPTTMALVRRLDKEARDLIGMLTLFHQATANESSPPQATDLARRILRDMEDRIRSARMAMRERGKFPPPLPSEVAYLDDSDDRDGTDNAAPAISWPTETRITAYESENIRKIILGDIGAG